MAVTQTKLERMENNMLKWYGHVACMEDKKWHMRNLRIIQIPKKMHICECVSSVLFTLTRFDHYCGLLEGVSWQEYNQYSTTFIQDVYQTAKTLQPHSIWREFIQCLEARYHKMQQDRNIIKCIVLKNRSKMRYEWVACSTRGREKKSRHSLGVKPEGMGLFGRPNRTWEDNY